MWLRLFVIVQTICGRHGIMHAYQLSFPWVLLLTSLSIKVPEVNGCCSNVVVMETMYYACIPTLFSMRATVNKFEE